VPLTNGQIAALKVIATERDPESYVAGATPLNRDAGRFSADIDIFNDSEARAAEAAAKGAASLVAAGFTITWQRRTGGTFTLLAKRDGEATKLEWVADSDFRFFPAIPDALFGYTLHPVDLAANKVIAAGNRRELRDLVDLIAIHETILPLGALIWAAVEKSPGFTPEGLIAEIRRNMNYPREAWEALATQGPIDPALALTRLRAALDEAESFVVQMPTDKIGRLFIRDGVAVQPDPAQLANYIEHVGQTRGHWPANPEAAAAMMARLQKR
jgi:hypothetical protein